MGKKVSISLRVEMVTFSPRNESTHVSISDNIDSFFFVSEAPKTSLFTPIKSNFEL